VRAQQNVPGKAWLTNSLIILCAREKLSQCGGDKKHAFAAVLTAWFRYQEAAVTGLETFPVSTNRPIVLFFDSSRAPERRNDSRSLTERFQKVSA
jgi:hypothetical protein